MQRFRNGNKSILLCCRLELFESGTPSFIGPGRIADGGWQDLSQFDREMMTKSVPLPNL